MRHQKIFVTAVLALALAACGGEAGAPPEGAVTLSAVPDPALPPVTPAPEPVPDEDAYVIVMLGDSLTAGYGLREEDALPAQVGRVLNPEYKVRMVNAGVSGDTTAGGLARYDWSVASADPDLVVIALGANDYLTGVDPDRTRANLAAIIERAQGDGAGILLASVSPRSARINDPRAAEFAEIYPALAETYGVAHFEGLIDAVQVRPEYLQSDGLHPTAEGVRVAAEPLAGAIRVFLED